MERGYFYDSTAEDQRIYQAQDWARFHAQIIGDGVSNDPTLPNLSVSAKADMVVTVGAGFMFANGYMYENTAPLDLTLDTAEPDTNRIDRIVVGFDSSPTERIVRAYVKKGAPGTSPVPPNLTRDSTLHEMSVAQIYVPAGKSFIESGEITDERADSNVCGYIPLHNIYRGLNITRDGIVSLLNQSFLKTYASSGLTFSGGDPAQPIPFGTIIEDTQSEAQNGDTFVPKADGIYNVWAEVGWTAGQADFPDGIDIQIYLYVNGSSSFPMVAKVLQSQNDNYVIANGMDRLQAGDEVQIRVIMFNLGTYVANPDMLRVRIAKIS